MLFVLSIDPQRKCLFLLLEGAKLLKVFQRNVLLRCEFPFYDMAKKGDGLYLEHVLRLDTD